jgi:uncharacterized protein YbjT (DUF2867 family)
LILLTGAAGKTGKTILNRLIPHGVHVRSLVRNEQQAQEIRQLGSTDVAIADLRDQQALSQALDGIHKIYFICPNMTPDEVEIGRSLITLAKQKGIRRFVYHSVLHPQVEEMPHHWQKMRMEECLFKSGLDFTILQPCAYMQNILANWTSIIDEGIYPVPYDTSARISVVDLEDVAAAAEVVLTQMNHSHAIYELAGPQALSQDEMAEVLTQEIGRPVKAVAIDRSDWAVNAQRSGLDENSIDTLLKMFEYYEHYGFQGNPNVLNSLLKKPATKFVDFVKRTHESRLRYGSNGQNGQNHHHRK